MAPLASPALTLLAPPPHGPGPTLALLAPPTTSPGAPPPAPGRRLHQLHGIQTQRLRASLLREAPAQLGQAAALLGWPNAWENDGR